MRFEDLIVKELERLKKENPEALKKPFIASFQRYATAEEVLEGLKRGKKIEEIV